LVDRLWLLSAHDWRSTVVLQPHPSDDQGVYNFWDNGKGRVLSVGTVKLSESVTLRRVSLVKIWGTIFSLSPNSLMRVLKSVSKRVVLVFWILEAILCVRSSPRVKFLEPIFLSVLALLIVWLLVFRQSFGNGIGD
jgi:hypothetical protein